MQVQKTSIDNLFSLERRYVVPLFQRPYVWTRERQWEPLWEDIRDMAERELTAAASPSIVSRPHFLGAIVLQSRPVVGSRLPALDVIDGQQRLTTLQLFLFALRDAAQAAGIASMVRWVSSKTQNPNVIDEPEVEEFKVWPTQKDVAQFKIVATAGGRAGLEARFPAKQGRRKLKRPLMVEAYLFFHTVLEEWFNENHDAQKCCDALRQTLRNRLELVQIDLDPTEEPQEIFETLNARGVPLLASDLLRNHIFQRAGGPERAELLYEKYWARFEEPVDLDLPEGERFWEVEERQGRLSRARLDLFVQHYLSMKLGTDVRITALFPEYKAWAEGRRTDGGLPFASVEEELADFSAYADSFRALLVPDTDTPLGVFAERVQALDISTAYPLIMGMVGNSDLPEVERSAIWRDVESFLVRRAVCGRPTKNYSRLFLQLLREFEKGKQYTREVFQQLLAAGSTDASDWPSDTAFEAAWMSVDAYSVLKPERVEMILRALELASRTSKSEPIKIRGRLTVEHVMPQKWTSHWPLPAASSDEEGKITREQLIHDFGNLTLLTGPLNTSLSNGPAAKKLPAIVEHSNLALNKLFIGRSEWSETDIVDRGRRLFTIAKQVWPRP